MNPIEKPRRRWIALPLFLTCLVAQSVFGAAGDNPVEARGQHASRVDALIQSVRDGRVSKNTLRNLAGELNESRSDELAIAPLVQMLREADRVDVKVRAAFVLGMLNGGRRAVPEIVSLIDHENPTLRRQAGQALKDIGSREEPVIKALADPLPGDSEREDFANSREDNPAIRREVARLFRLRDAEPPAFERALAALLAHEEYLMRRTAIDALAHIEIQLDATPDSLAKLLDSDAGRGLRLGAAGILLQYPRHERQAVAEFTRAFAHEENSQRLYALLILDRYGEHGKVLTPQVIELLEKDRDFQVREYAAYTLGKIKADPAAALPALAKALKSENASVRKNALDVIAAYGPAAAPAAEQLVHALRDEDRLVRFGARMAIVDIGSKADARTRLIFLNALASYQDVPEEDEPKDWLFTILEIAGASKDVEVRRRAVEIVAPALEIAEEETRRSALFCVSELQPESHALVPKLRQIIEDRERDGASRVDTMVPLMMFGRAAAPALPAIIAICEEETPYLREVALYTISQWDETGREALPMLRRVMANDELPLSSRMTAALGIAQIDPRDLEGVTFYAKHLARDDAKLFDQQLEALVYLGPRSRPVVPELVRILRHEPGKEPPPGSTADMNAAMVSQALGNLLANAAAEEDDVPLAVKALTARLENQVAINRHVAATALGKIGPAAESALPALRKATRDDDVHVRIAAALALWQLKQPAEAAVELLTMELARDRAEPLVNARALRSLQALSSEAASAAPVILQALGRMEDESDRIDAIGALTAIGPQAKEAVPVLEAMLRDESPAVKLYAAAALWRIDDRQDQALPLLLAGLKNEDRELRQHAATALTQVAEKAKPAFPALVEAIESYDRWSVRHQAVLAIKAIDPQRALPILRGRFQDETFAMSRLAKATAAGMEAPQGD